MLQELLLPGKERAWFQRKQLWCFLFLGIQEESYAVLDLYVSFSFFFHYFRF